MNCHAKMHASTSVVDLMRKLKILEPVVFHPEQHGTVIEQLRAAQVVFSLHKPTTSPALYHAPREPWRLGTPEYSHSTGAWRGRALNADAKRVKRVPAAHTEEGGTQEGDAYGSSSQAQAALNYLFIRTAHTTQAMSTRPHSEANTHTEAHGLRHRLKRGYG
eukprot:COSAG01_NODE_799_length_13501_cov_15.980749_4_plen_162_part_00